MVERRQGTAGEKNRKKKGVVPQAKARGTPISYILSQCKNIDMVKRVLFQAMGKYVSMIRGPGKSGCSLWSRCLRFFLTLMEICARMQQWEDVVAMLRKTVMFVDQKANDEMMGKVNKNTSLEWVSPKTSKSNAHLMVEMKNRDIRQLKKTVSSLQQQVEKLTKQVKVYERGGSNRPPVEHDALKGHGKMKQTMAATVAELRGKVKGKDVEIKRMHKENAKLKTLLAGGGKENPTGKEKGPEEKKTPKNELVRNEMVTFYALRGKVKGKDVEIKRMREENAKLKTLLAGGGKENPTGKEKGPEEKKTPKNELVRNEMVTFYALVEGGDRFAPTKEHHAWLNKLDEYIDNEKSEDVVRLLDTIGKTEREGGRIRGKIADTLRDNCNLRIMGCGMFTVPILVHPFFNVEFPEWGGPGHGWVVKHGLGEKVVRLVEAVAKAFPFVIPSCMAVWDWYERRDPAMCFTEGMMVDALMKEKEGEGRNEFVRIACEAAAWIANAFQDSDRLNVLEFDLRFISIVVEAMGVGQKKYGDIFFPTELGPVIGPMLEQCRRGKGDQLLVLKRSWPLREGEALFVGSSAKSSAERVCAGVVQSCLLLLLGYACPTHHATCNTTTMGLVEAMGNNVPDYYTHLMDEIKTPKVVKGKHLV